jgi:hypothetical protein
MSSTSLPQHQGRVPVPLNPSDPRAMQVIDKPLEMLAQWSGGDHRKFLWAFFSFLYRKTDFYMVPHSDDVASNNRKMGFQEGDAEKLLLAAFRQFPLRRMPPQKDVNETRSNEAATAQKEPHTNYTDGLKSSSEESELNPMHGVRYTEEQKQIPVGNGGSTPSYKWTQTLDECTVLVPVGPGKGGKDLAVTISKSFVSVHSKEPGDNVPNMYMGGNLTCLIKPEESTWSVEGGIVTLVLDKQQKTFWKTVLEGDEEIDTTLVDSRRHIQDYDESTQAQIRKIMHQQKLVGKLGQMDTITFDTADPNLKIPPLPPGVEYVDQKHIPPKG